MLSVCPTQDWAYKQLCRETVEPARRCAKAPHVQRVEVARTCAYVIHLPTGFPTTSAPRRRSSTRAMWHVWRAATGGRWRTSTRASSGYGQRGHGLDLLPVCVRTIVWVWVSRDGRGRVQELPEGACGWGSGLACCRGVDAECVGVGLEGWGGDDYKCFLRVRGGSGGLGLAVRPCVCSGATYGCGGNGFARPACCGLGHYISF